MDNLNLVLEAPESGNVSVSCRGMDVVTERQDSINRFGRPIGEEVIQEALVPAVEAPLVLGELDKVVEGIDRWFEDKNAGVEAARPAAIGDSGKFITVEEVVDVLED